MNGLFSVLLTASDYLQKQFVMIFESMRNHRTRIKIAGVVGPEWPSGIQRRVRRTDIRGVEPRLEPPPMLVDRSASMWIEKDYWCHE